MIKFFLFVGCVLGSCSTSNLPSTFNIYFPYTKGLGLIWEMFFYFTGLKNKTWIYFLFSFIVCFNSSCCWYMLDIWSNISGGFSFNFPCICNETFLLISDALQALLNTLQSEYMETWAREDWRPGSARVNTHSQLFTNQIKPGVTVWLLQINLHRQGCPSAAHTHCPFYNRVADTQVEVAGNINRLLTLPSTQRD